METLNPPEMLVPCSPAAPDFLTAMNGSPTSVPPSIALVTMTKNGVKRLPNLFQSVLGFVDKAVVLDTGSTDGTVQWLKDQSTMPVLIREMNFTNFQDSRNQLMQIAKDEANWLLLLDDDMGLNFETSPSQVKNVLNLGVGAYLLKHLPNPEYWVARLVRGDRLWKYRGVTHEYLEGGGIGNPKLAGVTVWHHFNHGPDKFNRDLKLLSADIARDPNDVRTIFYMANTLRDLGHIDAAIRFFCMRANMGGWEEEIYNSMYEAARLAKDPNGMKAAYEFRPSRAEAAAWLSGYYKFIAPDLDEHKFWEVIRASIPLPVSDCLFVIPFMYGPDFLSRLEDYK